MRGPKTMAWSIRAEGRCSRATSQDSSQCESFPCKPWTSSSQITPLGMAWVLFHGPVQHEVVWLVFSHNSGISPTSFHQRQAETEGTTTMKALHRRSGASWCVGWFRSNVEGRGENILSSRSDGSNHGFAYIWVLTRGLRVV